MVKEECNTYFRILSVLFFFCKICNIRILRWINKINIEYRKIQGIKLKYKHFLLPVIFAKNTPDIFAEKLPLIRLSYFFRGPAWRECTEKKEQKETR